jgi:hypothetical protein
LETVDADLWAARRTQCFHISDAFCRPKRLQQFKPGTLVWVGGKERFPTENSRALRLKKSAQFIRKK